jgi:hypothetical protein
MVQSRDPLVAEVMDAIVEADWEFDFERSGLGVNVWTQGCRDEKELLNTLIKIIGVELIKYLHGVDLIDQDKYLYLDDKEAAKIVDNFIWIRRITHSFSSRGA